MDSQYLIDHVFISVGGWAIGSALGILLVYAAARIVQRAIQQSPSCRVYLLFVPWRTLAVAILEFFYFPIPLLIAFGITRTYAVLTTAGQIAALAVLVIPPSLVASLPVLSRPIVLSGLIRSLGLLSIAATTSSAGLATAGLGVVILRSVNLLQYRQATAAWVLTVAICFGVDLVCAVAQLALWGSGAPSDGPSRTLQSA